MFFGILGVAIVIGIIFVAVKIIIAIFGSISTAIRNSNAAEEEKRKQEHEKQINSDLITAIKNGDKQAAQLAIENGAAINLVSDNATPLDIAKDEEIISLLKSHGAKTKAELDEIYRQSIEKEKQQEALNELLIDCIADHDINKVEECLLQGADINYESGKFGYVGNINPHNRGWTPLLAAVMYNDLEMLKFLIEKGADARYQSRFFNLSPTFDTDVITIAGVFAKDGKVKQEIADYLQRKYPPIYY